MTKEQAIEVKQPIVFAFYKDNKLKGFRQDTVGTVGLSAKIYSYSEDQVKTVLNNVFNNIEEVHKTTEQKFEDIANEAASGNQILATVSSIFRKTSNKLVEFGEFEVRVLPCPPKKSVFENDDEAFIDWLQKPLPDPIEIHTFKV